MVNQIHQSKYCDAIAPVSGGVHRPLWSVMIPTYNCATYLREALNSVLSQDPGSDVMQIAVVDDCSHQDDPAAIVEELGRGRVEFYCQPNNVGHVKNFTTCLQLSRGQLIHLLHGDDCVREGFYQKMQQPFVSNPELGAAFCRHIFMDEKSHWQSISPLLQLESGVLSNWLERIMVKQYIQSPSMVVRRDVYENLGGFDQRFEFYYEDWEMWVRIATNYPVWYEVEPLAIYRQRSTSNTGKTVRTGKNMQDVRQGLEIVQTYLPLYLPETTVNKLIAANRQHSATCALRTAGTMLTIGDISAGISQILEAFKCNNSPEMLAQMIYFIAKAGFYRLKSPKQVIT